MASVTNIEELEARNSEIKVRLEEIDEEFAGQAFPDVSRAEWNQLNEEREANIKLLDELRNRKQRVAELAKRPENREDGVSFHSSKPDVVRGDDIYDLTTIRTSVGSPQAATLELKDRAKRSIEAAQFPHERANREDAQGHVEKLVATRDSLDGELSRRILQTGSPTYRRAFGKSVAGQHLTAEEQRVLSLTTTEGGFAVPYTLDPTIIPTSNLTVNPFRAISRVETLTGSNEWRGVSSGAVVATRVAEATEATDNAPTLAQPTAVVTKAHTTIPFSEEIGADWGALESEMAKLIQDAKDTEEGSAFAIGVGTTVFPQGVAVGSTNGVAAATGLTVTAANVYALENALPPRFRPNSTFVANRGIYNVIRNIDTAGGAALWVRIGEGLANQVPSPGNIGHELLGRPTYESFAMQGTVVNATKILIIGDFNYFLIVDRVGLQVEVIPHLFGTVANLPTGQRAIRAYWRNTSKVLDAAAFRHLTGTT